jgi:DNA modification methylase
VRLADDPDFTLLLGDARTELAELEAVSVDCVVTSPPYWSLRDYDEGNQIGLEATVDEYVDELVKVFAGVHRVLADHGTLWLNLGDVYTSGNRTRRAPDEGRGSTGAARAMDFRPGTPDGLKQKELVGLPWRVAFALQAQGWYLRSENIWHKPNGMPESVEDRPSRTHEQVFMFTKKHRYFYDRVAVLEPYVEVPRAGSPGEPLPGLPGEAPRGPDGRRATRVVGGADSAQHRNGERWPNADGRNMRTVWSIATQPLNEKHFAPFPEALVEKCVNAGCPEWVCATCGKPRERIVERVGGPQGDHVAASSVEGKNSDSAVRETGRSSRAAGSALSDRYREHGYATLVTTGWSDCGHDDFRPGVVLDPFLGSGRTAIVARKMGRWCVGVELNEEYARLALRQTQQLSLLA